MTVYVIDAAHPLPPTYGERENALNLGDGDKVLLAAGSEIAAHGILARGIYGNANTTLILDGQVSGDVGVTTNGTVTIGSEGLISAISGGVVFHPFGTSTTDTLNNSGRIEGGGAGVHISGSHTVIYNSGEIHGGHGILFGGLLNAPASIVLNNTGLIEARYQGGLAVSGALHGSTTITNTGHIVGDIALGIGDDLYDGRGGTIAGRVLLLGGTDIAYGGGGSEEFSLGQQSAYHGSAFIDGGGGIDTVQFGEATSADLRISDRQSLDGDSWAILRGIENLAGGNFQDRLTGNDGANVLMGLGGDDRLDGQGGADLLTGGAGNDTVLGGEGTDMVIFSGPSYKYTITTGPDGTVTVTDTRASSDGIDQLTGVEFAIFSDRIVALPTTSTGTGSTGGGETVTPGGESTGGGSSDPILTLVRPEAPTSLTLKGGKRADVLVGGDGNDYLNGGLGKDKLTGGDGQDVFAFTTKLGAANLDRVLDFSTEDTLALSSKVFKGLTKGGLAKSAFRIGSEAVDEDDRILFNRKTGVLSFDADGSGTEHKAVAFAKLATKMLGAHDFLII
ncbi:calcium-binding protein [Microvirga sp. Mcv34]|uniref:calcium-binding protein n=1 Tax=Microvirga sp. Mcv34 TaxID=2926016 RepID=UPI0021C6E3D7|nr:calcium-binding protein [Microvirga sp. Mcv34]